MLSGDSNENGPKKSVDLISKKHLCTCSTLFSYISLPLFYTTTTWNFQKLPSYKFYRGNVVRVPVHFRCHCRSFSARWPLVFLSFLPPLSNFHVFFSNEIGCICFSLDWTLLCDTLQIFCFLLELSMPLVSLSTHIRKLAHSFGAYVGCFKWAKQYVCFFTNIHSFKYWFHLQKKYKEIALLAPWLFVSRDLYNTQLHVISLFSLFHWNH